MSRRGRLTSPRLVLCALGLVVANVAVPCFADDQALRERFTREAPAKWADFIAFTHDLQGTLDLEVRDESPATKLRFRNHDTFKQGSGGWLRIVEGSGRTSSAVDDAVDAVNRDYAFRLKRFEQGAPWVITQLDQALKDGESAELGLRLDANDTLLAAGIVVYNLWLPELVKAEQFKLKDVSTVHSDGTELVRVDYDYHPPEIGNHPACGGWMLLDPAHDWVLREFEVAGEWPDGKGTLAAKYEYDFASFPHPVIAHYLRRQRARSTADPPADYNIVDEITYDLTWRDDVPDSEFRLSAFGLPEPGRQPGRTWSVGIVLAALACVVLALVLRRASQRRA